ncbi:uncharacterized protein [Montipora foliosa]|uniref:uncharacterized protein n=1 Tax=Montipora foliosa TaxID=591990 RepID=UPI0035F13E08
MPRRNRIPFEHRERLVRAFEDVNEDYLIVADTLGINRSTARSIVSRYVREGRIAERPRGGPNHVRVDNEMRDCLNDILNENCLLTLTQLNQELRQRLPRKPRICERTVARTLEGMLFRVKLARPVPADRNRPDVIQKRLDYANWFMGHAVVNHSVFIDECGYNIWTARTHGRARRGERAYRQVCGQRGRNVTVTMAISPTNGLVFHSACIGGMNAQRFDDFLAQTRLNLDPDEHVIFIYDGAPAHNNPAIPGPNTELKKLPPYSPFLNIVEQAISSLKAVIKADISRPEIQEQMNNREEARRQGIALGNYRTQLLQQALQRNIGTITAAKCGQWYRFMQTFLPRCLNNEAIEG